MAQPDERQRMVGGGRRCDACCDCVSLCSVYWLVAFLGLVEGVVWLALQPLLLITGKPDHRPCASPEGLAAENPNRTNLKVIIPSTGASGTTSVHYAMCKLGFRSFHGEERGGFLPDTFTDGVSPEVLSRSVSRCRLDALFLEPTTDMLPLIMDVSPGAKYILTWRDYPSYYRSIMGFLLPLQDMLHHGMQIAVTLAPNMLRYEDWIDLVTGGALDAAWRKASAFGCPGVLDEILFYAIPTHFSMYRPDTDLYNRGVFKVFWDEESYIAQQDEIRRLVHPDDLLEFNVKKHGWREIEEFLGMSFGDVAKSPFPHPRKSNILTHSHIVLDNPGMYAKYYALSIALACLEIVLLLPLLRRLRRWLFVVFRCTCCERHRERWSAAKAKDA